MPKQTTQAAGAPRGRQPDPNSNSGKARALLATGMAVGEVAKKLGVSPNLVYNVKSRMSGGQSQAAKKTKAKAAAPKAAASRVSGSSAGGSNLGAIDSIVSAVKASETGRLRMRQALEQMAAVIAAALA